jgi:hypothetical protein
MAETSIGRRLLTISLCMRPFHYIVYHERKIVAKTNNSPHIMIYGKRNPVTIPYLRLLPSPIRLINPCCRTSQPWGTDIHISEGELPKLPSRKTHEGKYLALSTLGTWLHQDMASSSAGEREVKNFDSPKTKPTHEFWGFCHLFPLYPTCFPFTFLASPP